MGLKGALEKIDFLSQEALTYADENPVEFAAAILCGAAAAAILGPYILGSAILLSECSLLAPLAGIVGETTIAVVTDALVSAGVEHTAEETYKNIYEELTDGVTKLGASINYNPADSSAGFSITTSDASIASWPAASIALNKSSMNFDDGTSELIQVGNNGDLVTSNYAGKNGSGNLKSQQTDFPDNTSKITTYSNDGSSNTVTYKGQAGTGAVTSSDKENSDGTSALTTYNSAGYSVTTTYSGSNGTGTITAVRGTDPDGSPDSPPVVNGTVKNTFVVGKTSPVLGLSISDSDAVLAQEVETVVVSFTRGNLNANQVNGSVVTGENTSQLTIVGSLDAVNSALSTLTVLIPVYAYTPFTVTANDGRGGIACYTPGTRIQAPGREVAVEDLRTGHELNLASGETAPVVWIGHRTINCRLHPNPRDVWPVRISSHAFGRGLPKRDLLLSPDHALFTDHALVPVKHLVNDVSIVQERCDEIIYYHIELERHNVILAEGLPCESYLDTGNRAMFANCPVTDLHPSFACNATHAWTYDACAPLVESGPLLDDVRARVNMLAGIKPYDTSEDQPGALHGWAWQPECAGHFARLEILAGDTLLGEIIASEPRLDVRDAGRLEILGDGICVGQGDGRCGFTLRLPQPLSPFLPHTIHVRRKSDGRELWNSGKITLPAVPRLDTATLESFMATVDATVTTSANDAERATLLRLMANATDRLQTVCARASQPDDDRRPLALFIDETLPDPVRDSASQAALDHMRSLQTLGYRVAFAAIDPSTAAGNTAPLEALGVTICLPPAMASVEEMLRRLGPKAALVYLHRVSTASLYGALVRHHCPQALMVYAVADLHFVRAARQAVLEGSLSLAVESRRLRDRERLAARSADRVITHSPAEAAILQEHAPKAKVHVVPWSVPAQPITVPFQQRQGIAFIGGYRHTPNVDAAQWLIEAIMPLVWRQAPDIGCLLVGSHMPDSLRGIIRAGIVALGQVPDLSTIFDRVRLTVAPLRFGAGVKGKVLQSLAAGVPCIGTPIAAEGIALPPALAALIGEDATAVATAIVRLHRDEAENTRCAAAGLDLIRTEFAPARINSLMQSMIRPARRTMEALRPGASTQSAG